MHREKEDKEKKNNHARATGLSIKSERFNN